MCTASPSPPTPTLPGVLPAHAHVVHGPGVWMEGEAIAQLSRVANLPGCRAAVGLPDLHAGPGIPIGAALAFDGVVRPLLVGGDAGCGVRMLVLPRMRFRGDELERRVRTATEGPSLPEADPAALLHAVWHHGPRGLAAVPGTPADLRALAALELPELPLAVEPPDVAQTAIGRALGTIGGGNHFLELAEVGGLDDREIARTLGLRRGAAVVLAHSGSRGLGRWLIDTWGDRALQGPERARYLLQLQGTLRYARANRLVLAWRMLRAVAAARPGRICHTVDVCHNDVQQTVLDGRPTWLHRKGAAPAAAGQITVVLGSRGSPSAIMVGSGARDSLWSVAHGAGRRMGRTEALQKLRTRHTRRGAQRSGGGRVLCVDKDLLFTEHPDAYKRIAPVLQALVSTGSARMVAHLHPRITVKQ